MIQIDPRAAQEVQSEILSGETIQWAARPNLHKMFHSDDWTAIPFSALWLGFFVFWEADALHLPGFSKAGGTADTFSVLWGVPFLLVGNYMLWGRFLHDAWLKRRTHYAITNRRVLIVQSSRKRKSSSTFLSEITTIEREGNDIGTLWIGPKYPVMAGRGQKTRNISRFWLGDVPTLADINEVDSVHRLLIDLSVKSR